MKAKFERLKKKDWEVAMITNFRTGNFPVSSKNLEVTITDEELVLEYPSIMPFQEGKESQEGYVKDCQAGKNNCTESVYMLIADISTIVFSKKSTILKVERL